MWTTRKSVSFNNLSEHKLDNDKIPPFILLNSLQKESPDDVIEKASTLGDYYEQIPEEYRVINQIIAGIK